MSLPIVKVSGVASLTDARYCAGMGVAYLGILFDENGKSTLDRNLFVSIAGWIEGPEWVGEFYGGDPTTIIEIAEHYGLKRVEVDKIDLAKALMERGLEVAYRSLQVLPERADIEGMPLSYLLVNEKMGNNDGLAELSEAFTIILSPVTSIQQVDYYRNINSKLGYNLYSSEEERPGWMDLSGLQDILEAIDEAAT